MSLAAAASKDSRSDIRLLPATQERAPTQAWGFQNPALRITSKKWLNGSRLTGSPITTPPLPLWKPAPMQSIAARKTSVFGSSSTHPCIRLERPQNPLTWSIQTAFPVHTTKRGGQYTYHGPGQRIAYVMLDVGKRGHDVRRFVQDLENWVIATLAEFNVNGETREGRVGVWVQRDDKPMNALGQPAEDKVAALGIRLRKWISFHGLSINVEPDLSHFSGIVPCGITEHGVTSLVDLDLPVTMNDVDVALRKTFEANVTQWENTCSS